MIAACPAFLDAGFVEGVLATVDCQTRSYAEGGYQALTRDSGLFGAALTALLTLYVALLGWRLLLAPDGARLSEAPGAALRIGAILVLVTNWATFQTLVFDLADRAPVQVAAAVASPWTRDAGAGTLAARPVAGIDAAYTELRQAAAAFGRAAPPGAKGWMSAEAASGESLALAGNALLVMSIGVVGGAKLAIGILSAVGPVFIALALLEVTRGVFAGWVRSLVAAALSLLVGWGLILLLLVVLEPWLAALAAQREALALDTRTASSVAALIMVFAIGQGLLILAAWVAALGLRFRPGRPEAIQAVAPVAVPASAPVLAGGSRAERLAQALVRDEARFETRIRAAALVPARAGPVPGANPGARPRTALGDSYRRPSAGRPRGGA